MTRWWWALRLPVDIDADEARRRAVEELAKAKYGGTPDWVVSASDRLNELLNRLIEFVLGISRVRQSSGGGVNWGFVLAVVVVLVALGLVVWKVGLPRWQRRRGATVELDRTTAADDYRSRSLAYADRGEWSAAVRDRFRAVVRDLEVRTILDARPARTAWEAAWSATRQLPGATGPLHDAAAMFNDVLYGDRPADAEAYRLMSGYDDAIIRAADDADELEPAESR